jgi:multicomponent Na+:H+ antiporter subunit B
VRSLILRTAARFLLPLLLLFSIFLLLRGHNAPGGGFVGGLVAAGAFTVFNIAYDLNATRRLLPIPPPVLIGIGLLAAVGSALLSVAAGKPFMTALWTKVSTPWLGTFDLGTPLLFDLGVYLVVIGVTLLIILPLSEER